MKRIVVDTNVFVASAYDSSSASRRIVEACREGTLHLIASRAIKREYDLILNRAVRHPEQLESIRTAIDAAEIIEPTVTPRAVRDDPEDDKFFAAAWAAEADAIITNDEHLLTINGAEGLRILRPADFVHWALS